MSLFLWKKSYETGMPDIDVQHRRLVGMINELSDAMLMQKGQRTVPHILEELVDYIQLHFSTEEAVMLKTSYPDMEEHSQAHLDLTRQVLEFKGRFDAEHELDSGELLNFLCEWLKNHIMVSDREFGKYVRSIKSGK